MLVLGFGLAALVGLSLGLVGGGGSILTVPIFVYVLGIDPKIAIAMSLPVVGGASLIGAIGHWRAGNVRLRTAAMFGLIAMTGAYAGARLAAYLAGNTQLAIFAAVMVAAAASMLRSARQDRTRAAVAPEPETRPASNRLMIPVALGVGLLTGIVGVGGGFLIVPALVVLARLPMTQAVGTSLVVIAMNSLSGFAGYAGQVTLPWTFMLTFTAVAAGGILAGMQLLRYVSQPALKQGFAVFPLVVGALMLVNNFTG
jgi:hypothetical protein